MTTLDHAWSCVRTYADRSPVELAWTVVAFAAASRLQKRWPNNPLFNPTLCTIVLVIGYIEAFDISYESYLASTQIINFMLAPAVVLLAVPLYRRLALIKTSWRMIVAALAVGLPVGILSSLAIGLVFRANPETIYALAPRSVTAGIAMGIEEVLGGIPALTAVFVIATGIVGATLGPLILQVIGVHDHRVFGMAIGIGSHGIGTARAFQLSDKAGAFSSLAMALNGVATAIAIPVFASAMNLHLTRAVPAVEAHQVPPSSAISEPPRPETLSQPEGGSGLPKQARAPAQDDHAQPIARPDLGRHAIDAVSKRAKALRRRSLQKTALMPRSRRSSHRASTSSRRRIPR